MRGHPRRVEGPRPRERAREEPQRNDRHQHEHRSGHRIQEELDRRVDPSRAAPDPDQQGHGHQGEFPEDIKEQKIQGEEHPQYPCLQQQHQRHIFLRPLLDGPRGHQGEGEDQRRQQNQPQADPIHPHPIGRPDGWCPVPAMDELGAGLGRVESEQEPQPQRQDAQAGPQRNPADSPHTIPRDPQDQGGPDEGQEQHPRQDGEARHPFPPPIAASRGYRTQEERRRSAPRGHTGAHSRCSSGAPPPRPIAPDGPDR
ncbi:hypothetical protein HRbin22_02550 [Candidatus Thermoflexus japonica]|uniref:Uncharacterized protein n=1 Tax=Candidatus Thermoflexus japonica TaxID=2035417 RepID=A0A2H5YA40_9CHLR|nr:hypothetical protein HRbin22_02550 [Candidatus Thermoflexus japonica]